MPSNSANEKLKRAKRHLIAAKVLIGSLPSRYWAEVDIAEKIDTIADDLTTTQEKIKTIPEKPGKVKKR